MNRTRKLCPSETFLLPAFLCCVLAQASVFSQSSNVINLENADSLLGKIIEGKEVRELIGHVKFSQGDISVSCDRALQYIETGRVILTGNVVVQDDSVIIRAPRGMYHRDERRVEAFDSVSLDDGKVRLTARYGEYFVGPKRAFFHSHVVIDDAGSTVIADSLVYFRTEKRSVATSNVKVYNAADNVTIMGNQLEHLSEARFSRVTGGPVFFQVDTSASGKMDTLVVRSRVMESYRDSIRRLLAIDSVEIVRSDLAGLAGFAEFFTEGDSILLRSSPVIWYEQTQVTGDSINVYLKARKLHHVDVMGEAFALSQSDSNYPERFDQITGEFMRMHFLDRKLDRIDVERRAISVYHLYEDDEPNGLNRTSGDHIVLLFEKGKVQSIKIFGGVEGRYIPENLVHDREEEYRIAGFRWRDDRPQLLRGGVQIARQLVSQ
ncbi:MAG: hypothetical protein O7D34_02810 [Ignavibacteria bacterium]|nr:hypothetical protein [Ignavibacteria bacterium]